jgi:hypothetical protein
MASFYSIELDVEGGTFGIAVNGIVVEFRRNIQVFRGAVPIDDCLRVGRNEVQCFRAAPPTLPEELVPPRHAMSARVTRTEFGGEGEAIQVHLGQIEVATIPGGSDAAESLSFDAPYEDVRCRFYSVVEPLADLTKDDGDEVVSLGTSLTSQLEARNPERAVGIAEFRIGERALAKAMDFGEMRDIYTRNLQSMLSRGEFRGVKRSRESLLLERNADGRLWIPRVVGSGEHFFAGFVGDELVPLPLGVAKVGGSWRIVR